MSDQDMLTTEQFAELLPIICARDTSADPDGWTNQNPLWGHCAVVSLVAQNLFGGELLRVSLLETPFADMGSHYFNKFSDGSTQDFTALQFEGQYPHGLDAEERTREYVLSNEATKKRYKLLMFRLAKALNENTPIFEDPMYQRCFDIALDSPCPKMKFGCVITHDGEVVYEGCNKPIDPLASVCDPECIRLSIASRTESMLGACGHAEEGMWLVVHSGIPISECELYVAGFHANGLPWFKQTDEHTCLRCSVQMYNARLKTIYVPVELVGWAGISPERAVETARDYAARQKQA